MDFDWVPEEWDRKISNLKCDIAALSELRTKRVLGNNIHKS